MDYENQLRELENIIQNLESGEIGFDEAVKMFERGEDHGETYGSRNHIKRCWSYQGQAAGAAEYLYPPGSDLSLPPGL